LTNLLGSVPGVGMIIDEIVKGIEDYCCKNPTNTKKCADLEKKIQSGIVNSVHGIMQFLGDEVHHLFHPLCNLGAFGWRPFKNLSVCKTSSPVGKDKSSSPLGKDKSSSLLGTDKNTKTTPAPGTISPLTRHINILANPILGKGVWNTPLPVENAKFITDSTK
jgi:hypothetical protein